MQNTAVLSGAILVTLVGMMLHIHFVKVDHESLLVIGSLGIQVSSSYASGREITTFIEMSKIKDIVINEAIYMVRWWTCASVLVWHVDIFSCSYSTVPWKIGLMSNAFISASDHLLPLCTVEGPLRAWCSVKCCAIVSGEDEHISRACLVSWLPVGLLMWCHS